MGLFTSARVISLSGLAFMGQLACAAPTVLDAIGNGHFGLYDTADYRLANGKCTDCSAIPQALWYFQDDMIATARTGASGFDPAMRAQDDVQQWLRNNPAGGADERPAMIWVGSPLLAAGTFNQDGTALTGADAVTESGNATLPFVMTAKIPSNLSYYDASSVAHFAGRGVQLRGKATQQGFVARTIWPDDFALDFTRLPLQPLAPNETLEALVRNDGEQAGAPLAARVLWQRDPQSARDWNGKPVLAIMLNGAQGDDDEAHGGHFAIATGAFGDRGQWGDWLVNNYYSLGSFSEKGIVAAMLPMDTYMADLNSGQSWYRPSYMLVAVLNQPRAALQFQAAAARVYNHFYRHDFEYRHTTSNCTGISMDTLRSLGWNIPQRGPTNALKAAVALPFMALKEMSISSGEQAFEYLMTEQTILYPMVAFDAAGQDILQRISTGKTAPHGLESILADDIEALIYVRIPQFPSSRVMGQAPIGSLDEYISRVPEDRADWKIIPVPPREFPDALRDPKAPGNQMTLAHRAELVYGGLIIMLTLLGIWWRKAHVKKK